MSRRQGLRTTNSRVTGRQTGGARSTWKSGVWHPVQRTRRSPLTGGTIGRQTSRAVCSVRSATSLYHPLAVLTLQCILHRHSGFRLRTPLGLKMHLRGGFIFVERHRLDAHVHRQQIRALGKVRHHTLANGFLVLHVFLAAGEQNEAQGGCDDGRTNHISIIAAVRFGWVSQAGVEFCRIPGDARERCGLGP